MAWLSLDRISKLFGRFAALRELSAEFEPGRLYGIVGENGAGKSTLLRVIAGLARPSSGHLRWAAAPPRMGYMAHAPMLYDELSGMENLRYFAALHGMSSNHDAPLAQAMDAVGLDPALGRSVSAYSQGMRQRLSLARAVFHDPELLLLDEPFSNLDPAWASGIARWLGKWRASGKTLFVITHQIGHLEAIADEFVTMTRGQIVERRGATPRLTADGAAL